MERTVDLDQVASDPRLAKPGGIVDVLVVEEVERADAEPRGCEPAEVDAAGRARDEKLL